MSDAVFDLPEDNMPRTKVVWGLWLAITLAGAPAHAQKDRTAETEAAAADADAPAPPPKASPAEDDPAVAGARQFLQETMGLIEKAKWKDLKARIHPYTIKAMEERQKRTKRDDHNLAFWTHVKEWKIEKWEVTTVEPALRGTAVATTREDHFMIEEKGHDEGKDAEWLIIKAAVGGKEPRWWILDRRNGSSNFKDATIEKGFADVLPPPDAAPSGGPTTPLAAYQGKLEMAIKGKLMIPSAIPENQLKIMRVTIKLMVDERGKVQSRVVTRPSGNPDYDRAFIKAIDAVTFPAPDGEIAAKARDGIEVSFRGKP